MLPVVLPAFWFALLVFGPGLGLGRALVLIAGLPLGALGLWLARPQARSAAGSRLRPLAIGLNVVVVAASLVALLFGAFMLAKLSASHFH